MQTIYKGKKMQILIYASIFVAKMVEVSLSTVRNVLVNRGEKVKGSLIGFIEVLIWVIVVANVLSDIASDPIKVLVYCVAFSCGIYLGVVLEDKLAIGTSGIQAVIPEDKREELAAILREKGFGVTIMQGQGMEGPVCVLMIYLKRKSLDEASALIRKHCPNAMITINDVRHLRNGFIRRK